MLFGVIKRAIYHTFLNIIIDMIYDEAKYVSLCAHDFQKSLTNQIELPCKQKPNTIHKISQFGKICNKCTHIIRDSFKYNHGCIVCTDQLETYLKQREHCQHENREYFDVVVKCLNQNNKTHQVPFDTKICRRCSDKLRASFLNNKKCKVCAGQEQEVIRYMEKTFISSAFSHFKNVISLLRDAKASDEIYINQIESACLAQPSVERKPNSIIPDKLIQEFKQSDIEDNHQSNRYVLYPKCRKHKDLKINVCNMCLVALLNLDICPFGCVEQSKNQLPKADKLVKTSETGLLYLYPQKAGQSNYLEVFILKLIEEKGRMDRWQCKIQKVHPKSVHQIKFQQKFPIFSATVALSTREFLVSGGAVGPSISRMKTTNQAFVIIITQDLKQYSVVQIPPMIQARTGHSLVYDTQKKMVVAIGGLDADKNILKSTQVYLLQHRKWIPLGALNVERTRATGFFFKNNVYALGGQSRNPKIYQVLLQRLNMQKGTWQSFAYDGFDFPFITDTTPTSMISTLQNKQSLYLFGGSNISNTCTFIQPMAINNEKKVFELNHKKVMASLKYPRVNSTIGFINQDTLICFGGLQEHQDLFSTIEGFTLKMSNKDFSVFSKLDDIAIGSYKLILREDSKITYKRLYNLLEEQGILDESKLSKLQDKNLAESHNCHLIERLWYTFGKTMLWLPDIKL